MKKGLLLIGLFLLFGAAKCGKKSGYQLGELLRLQLGESARCQCQGPEIQFTAIKEDSRCPEYTNCIWEGQQLVQLSLNNSGRQYIDLSLRDGHPELASRKVGDYIYRLEKVSPYPQAGRVTEPEEYIVELVVEGI